METQLFYEPRTLSGDRAAKLRQCVPWNRLQLWFVTLLSQFEYYWSFLKLMPWDDKDVANFSIVLFRNQGRGERGSIINIVKEYLWGEENEKVVRIFLEDILIVFAIAYYCYSILLLSPGPFLAAEVGEILNVVFKNNATRPYSIHAHGVLERQTGQPQVANPGKSPRSQASFLYKLRKLTLAYS